jgi:hypothetical protein
VGDERHRVLDVIRKSDHTGDASPRDSAGGGKRHEGLDERGETAKVLWRALANLPQHTLDSLAQQWRRECAGKPVVRMGVFHRYGLLGRARSALPHSTAVRTRTGVVS